MSEEIYYASNNKFPINLNFIKYIKYIKYILYKI